MGRPRGGTRQRLEQREAGTVGHLAHGSGHVDVVDGVFQPVGRPAIADRELDVEDEILAAGAFFLLDPVTAEHAQPPYLDGDHAPLTTACATVSASTCSRTSWTRRIEAPRS